MFRSWLSICFVLIIITQTISGQQINNNITINLIKKDAQTLPGEVLNLPYFVKNNSINSVEVVCNAAIPKGWNLITNEKSIKLNAGEQRFGVFTIQVPASSSVGDFEIPLNVFETGSQDNILTSGKIVVTVTEVENISLQLVEAPEYVSSGENIVLSYLLQNLGNTLKSIYIQTNNCEVNGSTEIKLAPGESSRFTVLKETSSELSDSRKEFLTVRALIGDKIMESDYNSVVVFPGRNIKTDMFQRLPVTLSGTYVSSNQNEKYESAYQFELFGSGTLDPEGKHSLEFLARGPNNSDLSFLGMYDQYYVSYINKKAELFAGQKAFAFTPLTESSRFGTGTENKLRLNNGLFAGFLYVKPRFYEDIDNEFAIYSGFEKDRNNTAAIYYVSKKNSDSNELTHLASLNTRVEPFKKTTVELELSRGIFQDVADNAYRTNINTQFSIFRAAGNYFYTGKNYPGYYSNSTFYSGNIFANVTSKLNFGVYAREDFINAQLDTFFLYAPYSRSFQYILNYNISSSTYLKFYWRDYERKDRLELNKFHYKTNSINAQIRQKLRRFNYNLLGEIGETTNLLLESGKNQQKTYRASLNLGYRINSKHSLRVFSSWSNINSFVSGEKRNLTAGLSANSQILKNLRASLYVQNAYNIDDYYRNRNLMQFNLDYNFLRNHKFTLRSFYTIFRRQTDNPEFTFSATYSYNFGFPVKRLMKGGDLKGKIINEDGEPVEGVILHLLNRLSVSDKSGEFWFKSVRAGKYPLIMDNAKLKLNEVTDIPMPLEVDVIKDRETVVNIKVLEGSRIAGQFVIITSGSETLDITPENIVVELYNEIESFRISVEHDGEFSFPIVRPGKWTLKVYPTSLPAGFELNQTVYKFDLKAGEKQNIEMELKKKKRNIRFQSQQFSLSTSENVSTDQQVVLKEKYSDNKTAEDSQYYTIQVGAFQRRLDPGDKFFKGHKFDHEKLINNLYRYFIGTFENIEQAKEESENLEKVFRGAFVVLFKDGEVVYDF